MAPKRAKNLTPFESQIMNVLWDQAPSTVRQVHERLSSERPMAYNTVLTILRILRQKGFVESVRQGRADEYRPLVRREDMALYRLVELIRSFFSGSAQALVSQLLDSGQMSEGDIHAVRKLVDAKLATQRRGKTGLP